MTLSARTLAMAIAAATAPLWTAAVVDAQQQPAAPVPAPAIESREPGSVLIFPVHRTTSHCMYSFICITNTDLAPQTPGGFGGSVRLHYEYVNVIPSPQDPFSPLSCTVFDRMEFLSPADTLCVLSDCHNIPGQEGYLVVSAQDPEGFNQPISHNHLIGSECIVHPTGLVYCTNAFAIQAVPDDGLPTDLDTDHRLDFDDQEYTALPDFLMIDSFVALAQSELAFINLTGEFEDANRLYFSIYNDNERPLSATLDFRCWFARTLETVNPVFSESFLASLPNDASDLDINCDGTNDLETGWATVQSVGVRRPGGTRVTTDGAFLGSIAVGVDSRLNGGRLLWESKTSQTNGSFR